VGLVTRDADVARRQELGRFLRDYRARVKPADLGLVPNGRRRVPGLQRHEVADAAKISLTWYTWLEQGRDVRTTPQVLDSLARALRLDEPARRYLRQLGGAPVGEEEDATPASIDGSLREFLDGMSSVPGSVFTPAWDLLAWNTAWSRVFYDPSLLSVNHRNGLWAMFMSEELRERLPHWKDEAERAVARLRLNLAAHVGDERAIQVQDELLGVSPEFRQIWNHHEVRSYTNRLQVVEHPDVGFLRFVILQFRPADEPSLMMTLRWPSDDDTRSGVDRLLSAVPGGPCPIVPDRASRAPVKGDS
jgi:transcriptional regulator with XRE-family HTH domain